jgi:hypothetical protein
VFKTKEKFWTDQDDDKTFTATIHKLVRQFHLVAIPKSICGSFIRVGFSYSTGAIPYLLEFSRERMMESAGFWQFGNLEFPWKIYWCAGRRRSSTSSMRQVSSLSTKRNQNLIEQLREKVASVNSCIFSFSYDKIRDWDHISNVKTIEFLQIIGAVLFMIFLLRTREKCAMNLRLFPTGHTKKISHTQKATIVAVSLKALRFYVKFDVTIHWALKMLTQIEKNRATFRGIFHNLRGNHTYV